VQMMVSKAHRREGVGTTFIGTDYYIYLYNMHSTESILSTGMASTSLLRHGASRR